MFWKYNTTSSSQMDTLLTKEDVTLQEIMDSEDIISECRVQNRNLIDFLLRPEVMEELVTLTTREPSVDIDEKTRFKYPNIASELLTCDVPAINERLAGDERLLEKLYIFLENESPLNPLLASYFSKIMGALIAKKTEQNWLSYQLTCLQVLDFLKARDTFLPLLIKHLGTSAIMDLMLKLMTQVEGIEMRQNILNWLDSQRIIQQLVSLLNPKIDKERHDNVAQLLCDFIRIARDTPLNTSERVDPDPLLNTLESPNTVNLLLDQMFDGEKDRCESSIVGGIQVLLGLLDVHQTSFPGFRSASSIAASIAASMYGSINEDAIDVEAKQKITVSTTDVICGRLKDFHELLLNPPKQSPVLTTVGELEQPLGNTRLQVVRLLAAVIYTNRKTLLEELINLNTFTVLLDLFFKYTWNNFLHTQVECCIENALTNCAGGEIPDLEVTPMCKHLLENCNLVERVLKAWKENDDQQAEGKSIRKGYMGHLISIVNKIVDMGSSTVFGQHLKDLKPETAKALDEFRDTTLAEANRIQDILLGGVHPSTSLKDNDDFGDIPFPQSSVLQQQEMYAQYQMQNLTAQYIEGYSGFNDDAFNDGDDTLQTIDNPSDVNFDLSESEMVQRDDIFKQVCAQSINTLFDADDQIFEDKDHTFQTVIEKPGVGDNKNDVVYSSDSDDDDDRSPGAGEDTMDVDPWSSNKIDPWNNLSTAATTGSTPEDTEASSTGWADFSSAAFNPTSAFSAALPDPSAEQKEESSPRTPATSIRPETAVVRSIKVDRPSLDVSGGSPTKQGSPSSDTSGSSPEKQPEVVDEKKQKGERGVVAEQADAAVVVGAASGDFSNQQQHQDEKQDAAEGSSHTEHQPSMPVEGDTCKQPEKSQQQPATPPEPKADRPEKV